MQGIRTVTVSVTPLLSDIIKELVAEWAPIDIVARLASDDQLALHLQTLAPDLVLIGIGEKDGDSVVLSLDNDLHWARVIGLSHDARHAYLLEPHGRGATQFEMSPEALIEVIQGL